MSKKREKPPREKGWLSEFKEFATRGNVIDLAVGIIIGAAFGKVTNSLVNDVFMPVAGMLLGGVDFESLFIVLPPTPLGDKEPIKLMLGKFIGATVDFLMIALCVFLMVKLINAFRRKKPEEPKPKEPTPEAALLTEIRDLLKNGNETSEPEEGQGQENCHA